MCFMRERVRERANYICRFFKYSLLNESITWVSKPIRFFQSKTERSCLCTNEQNSKIKILMMVDQFNYIKNKGMDEFIDCFNNLNIEHGFFTLSQKNKFGMTD
ncbi:hypothetical protein BpHYR1_010285 [Brachionus plicatilis]|uniref:Uncharacterized protein n=1 Tax=Brachionus plicatilis TaxID=10195 RepID=A0A3M7S2L1_BRAPC|nr:hypothetical protein BpHYR1_010285 [Brachionus plicatilis]